MFINLLRIAIIFFTFGTVDILDSYTLHSIDNIVYEGLSLRDIFKDGNLVVNGDFSNGTTGWTNLNVVPEIQIVNETVEFQMTSSINFRQTINGLNNEIYYTALQTKIKSGTTGQYSIRLLTPTSSLASNQIVINSSNANFEIKSGILTSVADFDRLQIPVTTIGDSIYVIDNVYLIPMSLFTTAPSQTQLDEWLIDYLEYKDNTSFEYTLKTLGIEHLILFTTSMLFWYYSLKLLRKAIK